MPVDLINKEELKVKQEEFNEKVKVKEQAIRDKEKEKANREKEKAIRDKENEEVEEIIPIPAMNISFPDMLQINTKNEALVFEVKQIENIDC